MRRGFILSELLIVMLVLVLFAAIAMPRMVSALNTSHLDGAFAALRQDIVFTRTRAVSTGLRHQLSLDPQSGRLLAEAYHPDLEVTPQGAAGAAPIPPLQDQFPEEVRVVEWRTSPAGYLQGAGSQAAGAGQQPQNAPIFFYPEGRSDDARIVIEGADRSRRGLLVDGFSGEMRDLDPEEMPR